MESGPATARFITMVLLNRTEIPYEYRGKFFPDNYTHGLDDSAAELTKTRVQLIEALAEGKDATPLRKLESFHKARLASDVREYQRVVRFRNA